MLPVLLAVLLGAAIIAAVWIFLRGSGAKSAGPEPVAQAGPAGGRMQAGMRRRRARRARGMPDSDDENGEDGHGQQVDEEQDAPLTRKQAYDARRAQRDAEREAQEAAQEAEIAAAAAARAAREEEEAAKWRGTFTVEEAGQEALNSEEGEKQEARIIEFIQNQKTVELDELAAEFGMKVTEAIALVQRLEAEQKLTGIMDDRGKFIFISMPELESMAQAILSRGRISIAELANLSATLIDLEPKLPESTPLELEAA